MGAIFFDLCLQLPHRRLSRRDLTLNTAVYKNYSEAYGHEPEQENHYAFPDLGNSFCFAMGEEIDFKHQKPLLLAARPMPTASDGATS